MTPKTLNQHIEMTPGVCGGKPRVAGRRITVEQIATWHELLGISADEIASEYDLELADVYAALTYYFDHRQEIDAAREESKKWIEELKRNTPSLVKQKLQQD
jgi:uncharacterized protein (DUF433 family)